LAQLWGICGGIRTHFGHFGGNNGRKEKSAVKLYTWILKADIRNRKEDVPILTHPPVSI
jgi:hypothetical protein